MAKRFTDSEKFKDVWYRKLKPKHKCFWEYLLAECNHAGIIEIDLELASFLIGEEFTKDDLIPFQEKIEHLEKDLYFIPNFITFQYGKLSAQSKPHIPVIKILEKYNIPFDLLDENGLNNNQIRQRLTNKAKEKIYIRDKFECQYCGSKEDLEIDHIIPISKGGTNEDSNLITACHKCNSLKRDKDLETFINNNKNNINFLDRVYKILDTLKEKEKEKEKDKNKDINKVINKEEKIKKIDKFNNPYIDAIKKEYKKVFGKSGMLTAENLNKISELAENNPDFMATIPETIRKLKRVDFSEIGYNAKTLCWLFSKDHYEQVYSGTWDFETREEVVERLRNEELQRRKEYAAANGNRPSQ